MANISVIKNYCFTVNGVHRFYYRNNSPKTIKYVDVTVAFFNAVNDCVGVKDYRCIGPCEPGVIKNQELDFKEYLVSCNAETFKYTHMDITYMDNTIDYDCEWENDTQTNAENKKAQITAIIVIAFFILAIIFAVLASNV